MFARVPTLRRCSNSQIDSIKKGCSPQRNSFLHLSPPCSPGKKIFRTKVSGSRAQITFQKDNEAASSLRLPATSVSSLVCLSHSPPQPGPGTKKHFFDTQRPFSTCRQFLLRGRTLRSRTVNVNSRNEYKSLSCMATLLPLRQARGTRTFGQNKNPALNLRSERDRAFREDSQETQKNHQERRAACLLLNEQRASERFERYMRRERVHLPPQHFFKFGGRWVKQKRKRRQKVSIDANYPFSMAGVSLGIYRVSASPIEHA